MLEEEIELEKDKLNYQVFFKLLKK